MQTNMLTCWNVNWVMLIGQVETPFLTSWDTSSGQLGTTFFDIEEIGTSFDLVNDATVEDSHVNNIIKCIHRPPLTSFFHRGKSCHLVMHVKLPLSCHCTVIEGLSWLWLFGFSLFENWTDRCTVPLFKIATFLKICIEIFCVNGVWLTHWNTFVLFSFFYFFWTRLFCSAFFFTSLQYAFLQFKKSHIPNSDTSLS